MITVLPASEVKQGDYLLKENIFVQDDMDGQIKLVHLVKVTFVGTIWDRPPNSTQMIQAWGIETADGSRDLYLPDQPLIVSRGQKF